MMISYGKLPSGTCVVFDFWEDSFLRSQRKKKPTRYDLILSQKHGLLLRYRESKLDIKHLIAVTLSGDVILKVC